MLNSVSLRRNVGRSALHLACVSIKPCSRLYTQLRKFSSRQRGRGDWACGAVPGFLLLKALTLSLLLSTPLALHLPFTPLPLPSPLPFFLPSPLLLSLLLSPFSPIQSPQQDMCMDPLNGSISVDPINGSNQWIHFCFLFKLDNLLKKQKRQLLEKAEEASLLNEIQEYIDQGIQSRAYLKLN